ncbi:MAG: LamG domain-containing protein, partial [Proteobacteria bacterium]|nr:LamG domain-containing protein [Pseudomonadota bacterium]
DAVLGKGASFDGKSWIEVSDSDSLDLSNAFTFSVWLYKQDAGTGGCAVVFTKGNASARGSNTPYSLFHSYDGKYPLICLVKNNYREIIGSTAKINFSVWYLLTVTWDGGDIKYYINAELKDTKEWVGTLPNSDSKLIIGSDERPGAKEYFRGVMDDLRIYDHALSGDEIKALYEGKEPSAGTIEFSSDIGITLFPYPKIF